MDFSNLYWFLHLFLQPQIPSMFTNRKYLPFIALLAAGLLLFWVKRNQRGKSYRETIPIEAPAHPSTRTNGAEATDAVNRDPSVLVYSKHARCRMNCRHIDESEVKEILANGKVNEAKIETSEKGTSFPLEGTTHDNQHVRIVVAPKQTETVVVTVIDLDTEWPCDCP